MKNTCAFQICEPCHRLKESLGCLLREGGQVVIDFLTVNELHQNEPSELVGIEVLVEDAHNVLMVGLVQEFDFADKTLEELLSLGFRVRHVFLAHEGFVNEVVVKKDCFTAGTLSKLSDESVVALSEKMNDFVLADRGPSRGPRWLGWS